MDPGATLHSDVLLSHLKEITAGFSNDPISKDAGVGTFFAGTMPAGELVAVKILTNDKDLGPPADTAYINEIRNIERLRHENIVKLAGYCSVTQATSSGTHTAQYVICYEHLSRGSLTKFIDDPVNIDWGTRFKIIQGICRGLHFLHTQDSPILHMDLNPGNIWLDTNSVPKILNFGVSKLLGKGQTTKHPKPARGYMAPEYCHQGEFSKLSDIYSLGLLIIEITTGEKNDQSGRTYIKGVRETWTERYLTRRYKKLDSKGLQNVKACLDIGLQCVEIDPKMRPSLEEIVQKLGQGHGL